LDIILFNPEIPPNTGNIIRLCANCGFDLHLIKPLGFPLEDKKLRRAGLDYHEFAKIMVHDTWKSCKNYFDMQNRRIIAVETCGSKYYHQLQFYVNDALLFGSETKGLPLEVLENIQTNQVVKIPMVHGQRSLNLSNSVAIVAYEAWRQCNFIGGVQG
jgi:tRNA (cytidine/uridine-2'-O-)-methyltransferase